MRTTATMITQTPQKVNGHRKDPGACGHFTAIGGAVTGKQYRVPGKNIGFSIDESHQPWYNNQNDPWEGAYHVGTTEEPAMLRRPAGPCSCKQTSTTLKSFLPGSKTGDFSYPAEVKLFQRSKIPPYVVVLFVQKQQHMVADFRDSAL